MPVFLYNSFAVDPHSKSKRVAAVASYRSTRTHARTHARPPPWTLTTGIAENNLHQLFIMKTKVRLYTYLVSCCQRSHPCNRDGSSTSQSSPQTQALPKKSHDFFLSVVKFSYELVVILTTSLRFHFLSQKARATWKQRHTR